MSTGSGNTKETMLPKHILIVVAGCAVVAVLGALAFMGYMNWRSEFNVTKPEHHTYRDPNTATSTMLNRRHLSKFDEEYSDDSDMESDTESDTESESDTDVVQLQREPRQPLVRLKPQKTPSIEEWNDIRWFYTSSLPVTLTQLNVSNCVECELLDAVVPRGQYIINTQNNTFEVRQPFEASLTTYTPLTIPVGDYSASSLALTINGLIAAAGFTNVALSFVSLTKNFVLTDDTVLDLKLPAPLAYDLGWGTTTNIRLGSVQYDIPSGNLSYQVVTGSNDTFEVAVGAGAFVTYTIAPSTYSTTTLVAAMNTAIGGSPAGLTVAHVVDVHPNVATIAFHHAGNAFSVRLSPGFATLIGQFGATVTSVLFNTSTSRYYSTSARADLYGSRYVEIRSDELCGNHLHHRGILQAMFLENEITNWRNTGGDDLRRRRFPQPVSLSQLTLRFKERHPALTEESHFRDIEHNGLAVSFCICFRRLRYTVPNQISQLSMS